MAMGIPNAVLAGVTDERLLEIEHGRRGFCFACCQLPLHAEDRCR
jgi:hypothetical protein